jgi:hypothetical protein
LKLSKVALAKQLKIAPSTLSGYISRGLPCAVDGSVDKDVAVAWIRENVKLQAGRRGPGARAALRASKTKEYVTDDTETDPIFQSTRLTKLRADKLEMENAKLAGGSENEQQLAMAEATALHCWWCFQRQRPDGAASALAFVVDRQHDRGLLHTLCELTRERDQHIAREIYEVLVRAFAGLIPPVRDPAPGTPWRPITPKRRRTEEDVRLVDGRPWPPRKPEADDEA